MLPQITVEGVQFFTAFTVPAASHRSALLFRLTKYDPFEPFLESHPASTALQLPKFFP
ncbi:MAG: hypothetical protein KKA07_08225 [Bacteroidetes bacterium]|nr:hypothetical protein [Bacteroidota bacterium]MBU1719046.1 hypothetical protein [Bacteroidota bacterium]